MDRPIIRFIPASHSLYQCGDHLRRHGGHGGCKERRMCNSTLGINAFLPRDLHASGKKKNQVHRKANHSLKRLSQDAQVDLGHLCYLSSHFIDQYHAKVHRVQEGLQCSRIFDTQKILQTLQTRNQGSLAKCNFQ